MLSGVARLEVTGCPVGFALFQQAKPQSHLYVLCWLLYRQLWCPAWIIWHISNQQGHELYWVVVVDRRDGWKVWFIALVIFVSSLEGKISHFSPFLTSCWLVMTPRSCSFCGQQHFTPLHMRTGFWFSLSNSNTPRKPAMLLHTGYVSGCGHEHLYGHCIPLCFCKL